MELSFYFLTAGRAFLIYFLMLVLIRSLGKREIGAFSAFDLLVALMLGEVVDEIIYGEVPLSQGIVSILAIAAIQFFTSWLSFSFPTLEKIIEGKPSVVIRDGKFQRNKMRRELISERDLLGLLRELNIEDINEVKVGTIEVNGELSVIKQDWAQPVTKEDLKILKSS